MQANPLVLFSNDRREVKKALRTIWGSAFIPETFDRVVIALSLDAAYSVYGDATGDVCIDPERGTVVRFVKQEKVKNHAKGK